MKLDCKKIIRVAKQLNKTYRTSELQKPRGQHVSGYICNALNDANAYAEKVAFQHLFKPEDIAPKDEADYGYFGEAYLQKNKDARLTALLLFAEMVKHGDA